MRLKNMSRRNEILIDGLSAEELLSWSDSPEFQEIVFTDEAVIFRAGTSQVLGQFKKDDDKLRIVLSHIEGGGEGVLLTLMNLVRKFGKKQELKEIEWIVHAVDCPKPNPRLPRILELKGFHVFEDPLDGQVYRQLEML